MKNYRFGLIGLFVLVILLFVYFGYFICHANQISHGLGGDGYKNFFTLAYYLKYDWGSHFSGMNHPYGENVIYTDNQPLVAWALKPFFYLFPSLNNYIHAIVFLLALFSFAVCYAILYKLLYELNIPGWAAALFAILITLLSPQLVRISGHFSLAYSFVLPLVLLLTFRYLQSGYAAAYVVYLSLLLTISVFIHPYFFAIAGLLLVSLAVLQLVTVNPVNNKIMVFLKTCTPVIIAFAVFKVYILMFDNVTDRPAAPWGFLAARATYADILLHPYGWATELIQRMRPGNQFVFSDEGRGYIGVIGVLVLCLLLFSLLVRLTGRRLSFAALPYNWALILLASVPVLLFAMAFPFYLHPKLEKAVEYLPVGIKQFRASGRFIWMFYYTFTITAAWVVYKVYTLISNRKIAMAFLSLVIAVWFIDINMINNRLARHLKTHSTPTDEYAAITKAVNLLQQHGKKVSDYQAIFPLPFFLNGSEKIYREPPTVFHGMQASLVTGLPLVCGQMSRTSISTTFKIANLLSCPHIKKDILKDYNSKPLLLVLYSEDMLNASEKQLLNHAQFLFKTDDGLSYFHLPLSAFNDSITLTQKRVADNASNLINHGNYSSFDSAANVVYKDFDNMLSDRAVFGPGAVYSDKEDVVLYMDTLPHAVTNGCYEVSCWFYSDKRRAAFHTLSITQIDSTGKETGSAECDPKFSTNTYGEWVYGSLYFNLTNHNTKIRVMGKGFYATYDELIIRPVNTAVITHYTGKNTFMYNNFPIY